MSEHRIPERNRFGSARGRPVSPWTEAENILGAHIPRARREAEIDRNPEHRALRLAVYHLALRIAAAREKERVTQALASGAPIGTVIWDENRPNGIRRAKRCSNCGLLIKRPKSGRCRLCAQAWAKNGGRRERYIDRGERDENALWRLLAARTPRRSVGWVDPTLRFRAADERAGILPDEDIVLPNGCGAPRRGKLGTRNGQAAPFGDPDWGRHLTNLVTNTIDQRESA